MTQTRSRVEHRPVKGWRADPRIHPAQLTHVVPSGRHTALCGIQVAVLGEPWPSPAGPTPTGRCSVCTAALEFSTGYRH